MLIIKLVGMLMKPEGLSGQSQYICQAVASSNSKTSHNAVFPDASLAGLYKQLASACLLSELQRQAATNLQNEEELHFFHYQDERSFCYCVFDISEVVRAWGGETTSWVCLVTVTTRQLYK